MAKAVAVAGLQVDKKLIELEEQSESLGEARKALESATNVARGLWITFLSLSTYLAVAAGSVTHRDLFLEKPIKLPLLNADLPLVAFFWIAPLLLVVYHGNLMLNLKFMGDNARKYFNLVDERAPNHLPEDARFVKTKESLFLQLPNFVVIQMLIARRLRQRDLMASAIYATVVLTVVISPILVLLLMQLQFLPYHSALVTAAHRLAIIADIALVWYLWPKITAPAGRSRLPLYRYIVYAVMAALVVFSVFIATFPGDLLDGNLIGQKSGIRNFLFRGTFDEVKGKRNSWFSDTLILSDQIFTNGKTPAASDVTVSMRGRRFEEANFTRADLRSADFSGARMARAILRGADLENAKFSCPNSVREKNGDIPDGKCTQLQQADFKAADMRGATLESALLQGASFEGVNMEFATLEGARLQAALITSSDLTGVNLKFANLTGALVQDSQLLAADFSGANLSGALIYGSNMQGAALFNHLTSKKVTGMATATLVGVNVWNLDDSGVDWTTTVVKDLKSTGESFDIAADMKNFSVAGVGGKEKTDAEIRIEALDPEKCAEICKITRGRKAEEISLKAIRNYPNGGMESDAEAWRRRVTKQVTLMCDDLRFGGDVLKRIAFNRASNDDKRILFGPYLNATAALLLDPKQCKYSDSLRSEFGAVIEEWAGDGIPKAALLEESKALKASTAGAAGN
jgi:uncharacterized protein YjbI with pentapeptide repeats